MKSKVTKFLDEQDNECWRAWVEYVNKFEGDGLHATATLTSFNHNPLLMFEALTYASDRGVAVIIESETLREDDYNPLKDPVAMDLNESERGERN